MLGRIGAGLKGAVGGRLTYSEITAIVASQLEKVLIPPDLAPMIRERWRQNDRSFDDTWREAHILPYLRKIADEPTHTLQKQRVIYLVLQEQETLSTGAVLIDYTDDEAEAVLREYPNDRAAEFTLQDKFDVLLHDRLFSSLNNAVLMELAATAYGANYKELDLWVQLYGESYKFFITRRFVMRKSHVKEPEMFTLEDSIASERSLEWMFQKMQGVLSQMKDDIAHGHPHLDRQDALRQQLNDLRDQGYFQITGKKVPDQDQF